MNKKLAKELSQPFMLIGLIVMLVLGAVIMWFNMYVGLGALFVAALVYFFHLRYTVNFVERTLEKNEKTVIKEHEGYVEAFSNGAPLLICVASRSGDVVWSNPSFDEFFADQDLLRANVSPANVKPFFDSADTEADVVINGRNFKITAEDADFRGHERRMLFFADTTELEDTKAYMADTRPCAAYINVDNYDDMLEASPVEEQSSIAAAIDRTVHNWAIGLDAVLLRARSDRYLMVFEHKYLEPLRNTRFPILNVMHDIETNADFPASLSIGVCEGDGTLAELQEGASAALDLALGRGGDQAVVRTLDGDTDYYGGALPAVEKRNKGKSRVMAHQLSQAIEGADNVLIMGHTRPDLDSFGSALGVYALVNNCGKQAAIVLEDPGDSIDLMYNAAKDTDSYIIVGHDQAKELMGENTLLIMVDHHRAAISEFPELIPAAKKNIAIIDHHRRAGDAVEDTVLSYTEAYASSASELICELLQYSGERGEISRFEAEALMAGIALDTKNFTVNTGVRTFEAASWLRRSGADMANVKKYFKIGLDFYQKKARIVSSTEVMGGGIAVAYTRESDPAMQMLAAQVADELLEARGVEAAFVAGRGSVKTMISARSNGKINVQTIMEKLGGGGHQTGAAAQVDLGPEEAIALIVAILREEKLL
ncbi:MAG: DHH family phosphoesterase [Firmicutes bacterium]|nr:DHH family phosphoesterase [Bacillota bacterium]